MRFWSLIVLLTLGTGCEFERWFSTEPKPRLSLFVGVDISGSFVQGKYFDDSLDFLAHYIYAHLNGLGDLEKPRTLFVGSIGGATKDEPKTFFPIQVFEGKSLSQVRNKLKELFPKEKRNPYTDFNAFIQQVAEIVESKKLILRPISIVMVTDGKTDAPGVGDYGKVNVKPLEKLARSVTLRLLYTDAVTGQGWRSEVPRRRARIWTQDAPVMVSWRESNILIPGKPLEKQEKFFSWIKDNVDFGVRAKRVD